jgi:hypothetical protein
MEELLAQSQNWSLWDWCLRWMLLCLMYWVPLWWVRGRGESHFLAGVNLAFFLFVAWWPAWVLCTLLFGTDPLRWVATFVTAFMLAALCTSLLERHPLWTVLHMPGRARASRLRMAIREAVFLSLGFAILAACAAVLPLLPTQAEWSPWEWSGRCLAWGGGFFAADYAVNQGWRVARERLPSRRLRAVYLLALFLLLLLTLGRFFLVVAGWWLARFVAGRFYSGGEGYWAMTGLLAGCHAVLVFMHRNPSSGNNPAWYSQVARDVITHSPTALLAELGLVAAHALLLLFVAADVSHPALWLIPGGALIAVLRRAEILARRRPPARRLV